MTMAQTHTLQFEMRPLSKISLSTEAQLQSTSRSRSRESRKGISETEGKVARVATSKLGNERVSNWRTNQTGGHRCLVVATRAALRKIDSVEVDDIISYHD